jgi:hypothetical protein
MNAESTAFREVVRFCVGSAAYRRDRTQAFIDAVEALPDEHLVAHLGRAHLAGLFSSIVARHDLRSPTLEAATARLAPALRARAIFNRNLLAELVNLGSRLADAGAPVRPVVLKGIGHWDTYYDDPISRRVRDLDLYLETADEADILCDVLEREGYESLHFVDDARTAREHFRSGDSYSAPPLRIRRRADLEDQDRQTVEAAIRAHGGETGLELIDDGGPVLTIDVELHKALFATVEGTFADADPADFRDSDPLPGFRDMTTGAALAYSGVKLSLDILETLSSGEAHPKCLKIAADFVRILERSRQRDLDDAIAAARRWRCLPHFAESLQAVRPLVPEIAIPGLPASDDMASLDLLLHAATENTEEHASCSE